MMISFITDTNKDRTAPSFTSIEDFGDAHITAPPYGILVGTV